MFKKIINRNRKIKIMNDKLEDKNLEDTLSVENTSKIGATKRN